MAVRFHLANGAFTEVVARDAGAISRVLARISDEPPKLSQAEPHRKVSWKPSSGKTIRRDRQVCPESFATESYYAVHAPLFREPTPLSHMNLIIKSVDLRTVIQQSSCNFQAAMKRREAKSGGTLTICRVLTMVGIATQEIDVAGVSSII
jgi:hypothetical protein